LRRSFESWDRRQLHTGYICICHLITEVLYAFSREFVGIPIIESELSSGINQALGVQAISEQLVVDGLQALVVLRDQGLYVDAWIACPELHPCGEGAGKPVAVWQDISLHPCHHGHCEFV